MNKFNFINNYIIENERVKLSPLQREDFENLRNFAINEPELWEFSLQPAMGLNKMENYIRSAIRGRKEQHAYPFIVFDKRNQQYAGSTRFYDFQEYHKTVQLGYTWYGKEFQGSGINKQCKLLLLEFAFETLSLERVEFRADYRNKRSISAMKSIGCIAEGVLRSNCTAPGGRRDSIVLSILKDEWFGGTKELLLAKIDKENINFTY